VCIAPPTGVSSLVEWAAEYLKGSGVPDLLVVGQCATLNPQSCIYITNILSFAQVAPIRGKQKHGCRKIGIAYIYQWCPCIRGPFE
jgi:hypothetical protein